jgi:iron-sulfur cluster repair protein YtfE (RIC family)
MARAAVGDGSLGRCRHAAAAKKLRQRGIFRRHSEAPMTTTFAEPTSPTRNQPRPVAAATAPRHDLYASIHKALRSFMSETLLRISRIDVADATDRDAALAELDALLTLCSEHLRHENEFVHTAIEARQPAGSRRVADEHNEHLQSIAALRAEAEGLRSAAPDEADRLALRLYRHLALFVAENFQHMHIEETAHHALLWQHCSDAELDALHDRLLASIAPQEHVLVARWMVPACTPRERAAIVGAAQAQMPPEAVLGVLAVVRPHVDDTGWLKLAAAVGIDPRLGRG